jgi:NADH-quinone oxidoreductase subunit I
MFGFGIFKGLGLTLKHLVDSYWDDLRWLGKRYFRPEGIAHRSGKDTSGIFTIQYPEEKLPVPPAFRVIPFLVLAEAEDGTRKPRCTACGICAKVCPPQCIWITRGADPATGKPVPAPAEFYLDIDLCMNCGLCAEYCPFDAIQMDREYELASRNRAGNIYNLDKLLKPEAYHAAIHPQAFAEERAAREAKNSRRMDGA